MRIRFGVRCSIAEDAAAIGRDGFDVNMEGILLLFIFGSSLQMKLEAYANQRPRICEP